MHRRRRAPPLEAKWPMFGTNGNLQTLKRNWAIALRVAIKDSCANKAH